MQKVQLTKEGLDALVKELHELKEVKRPALVERLAHARAEGDLSENSDYQNARDELDFLDGRITEYQEMIKKAEVVNHDGKGEIAIGAKVEVRINGNSQIYHIVGEWEADPLEKKISHTSPLGQALVGKKPGDKVEVDAPAGKVVYEILSVK